MNSPAIAKNVLAVGASTSGRGRLSWTGVDGKATNGTNRVEDIDTVAYFSSFGPTLDGRIKPEVVAPGDLVRFSVAGCYRLQARFVRVTSFCWDFQLMTMDHKPYIIMWQLLFC